CAKSKTGLNRHDVFLPIRPRAFQQNSPARLSIRPDVDTAQDRYTQVSTCKDNENAKRASNHQSNKARKIPTMKTQPTSQAKPAKKLALSKQTIRVLTSGQASREPATATRHC